MGTPPMPGIIIRLGRPRPPTQMNRHREKTKGAWRIPSSLEFDRGYTRAYRPTRGSGWARLTGWPKTLVDFGVWEAVFRPFSRNGPAWPKTILFGQVGFILLLITPLRAPPGAPACRGSSTASTPTGSASTP